MTKEEVKEGLLYCHSDNHPRCKCDYERCNNRARLIKFHPDPNCPLKKYCLTIMEQCDYHFYPAYAVDSFGYVHEGRLEMTYKVVQLIDIGLLKEKVL